MEINFMKNGTLQIDDAKICYRNFSGRPTQYNHEGQRNFSLIIPDEDTAELLRSDVNAYGVGWNVKSKPSKNEDEEPFRTLKVSVRFNARGPQVYLRTGNRDVKLTEESVGQLDDITIDHVDLDIRPYDDGVNGTPFRAAYLQSIRVVQAIDRFTAEYLSEDEELPFY